MGALATGTPMGASHGIGYVLGAAFDVPHGYTSCIMLPAVMQWNKSTNADRQALVAEAMGSADEDAGGLLDRFIGGLGMPRSLSAVEIGPENFRDDLGTSNGNAVGAAESAPDRRAGAGKGNT